MLWTPSEITFSAAELYSRHQIIVECWTAFVAAAGFRATNEAQIAGRKRPGEIFMDRWTSTDPVALDVTITTHWHRASG